MRVFLDTNVLVAAFATRGLCADVMRVVLAEHQVTGDVVLRELRKALARRIKLPRRPSTTSSRCSENKKSCRNPAHLPRCQFETLTTAGSSLRQQPDEPMCW